MLLAEAADVVIISWSRPQLPNGLIDSYSVSRRLAESAVTITVYVGDNETFTTSDNQGMHVLCSYIVSYIFYIGILSL